MSEPRGDDRPHTATDAPVIDSAPGAGNDPPSVPGEPGVPAYGTPPYQHGTPPYQHGTPPYQHGTPPYQQGSAPGYPAPTLGAIEERNWAVAAHLSGFVAAYLALGFIGPLVVLLASGNRSPFVRRHALEALNFNLSVLVYVAISVVLVLLLIGIPMLIALALLYLVTTIQGSLAASRGEEFRYPLSIRFIH